MAVNPYESPLADVRPSVPESSPEEARRNMQLVIRLYWWMGIIGLAIYASFIVGCIWANWSAPPQGLERLNVLLALAASAVFVCSLAVSKRLARKPKGILAAANWVALIIAVAWFPWMTVPAIICRRRLHLYYATYCESIQGDRAKPCESKEETSTRRT